MLKTNGTLAAWGDNSYGQATPPGSNDFSVIAAGWDYSIALKTDGSIVGWGNNSLGQTTTPSGNDYVAITAGHYHN